MTWFYVTSYGFVALVALFIGWQLLKLRRRKMRSRGGEAVYAGTVGLIIAQVLIIWLIPDDRAWLGPLVTACVLIPAYVHAFRALHRLKAQDAQATAEFHRNLP